MPFPRPRGARVLSLLRLLLPLIPAVLPLVATAQPRNAIFTGAATVATPEQVAPPEEFRAEVTQPSAGTFLISLEHRSPFTGRVNPVGTFTLTAPDQAIPIESEDLPADENSRGTLRLSRPAAFRMTSTPQPNNGIRAELFRDNAASNACTTTTTTSCEIQSFSLIRAPGVTRAAIALSLRLIATIQGRGAPLEVSLFSTFFYALPENAVGFATRPKDAVAPGQPAVDPLPRYTIPRQGPVAAIVVYRLSTVSSGSLILELSQFSSGTVARSAPYAVKATPEANEVQLQAMLLTPEQYFFEPGDGVLGLDVILRGDQGQELARESTAFVCCSGPELSVQVESPAAPPEAQCELRLNRYLTSPTVFKMKVTEQVPFDPNNPPPTVRATFSLLAVGELLNGDRRPVGLAPVGEADVNGNELQFDLREMSVPLTNLREVQIVVLAELSNGKVLRSKPYTIAVTCIAPLVLPKSVAAESVIEVPVAWNIPNDTQLTPRRVLFPPGDESIRDLTGERPFGTATDVIELTKLGPGMVEYLVEYMVTSTRVQNTYKIPVFLPLVINNGSTELPKAKLDNATTTPPKNVSASSSNSTLKEFINGLGVGLPPGVGAAPSKMPQAAIADLPPFAGIQRTWAFTPGIPRDGSFSADLTLFYEAADLPNHPGFDESKLEMVAYDPVTGDLERLASRLDRTARSVTARVDRLAPYYSLVAFAPLSRVRLGAPALPAGGGLQAGLAAVNLDVAPVNLQLRVPGTEPLLEVPITLGPGQQAAGELSQLAPGVSPASAPWVVASGGGSTVAAQLLRSGSAFDVVPVVDTGVDYGVFPGVSQSPNAATTFYLANPENLPATAQLTIYDRRGAEVAARNYSLGSEENAVLPIREAFPNLPLSFEGYAVVRSSQPLFATSVLAGSGAIGGSNAQPVTSAVSRGATRLYAPFLGDEFAVLRLVNLSQADARITVRGHLESGAAYTGGARTAEITLAAGQAYQSPLAAALGAGTLPRGSLVIESSSDLVFGELQIGDPLYGRIAILPLARAGATALTLPYIANDGTFSMSLTAAGVGGSAVNATVTAYRANGTVIGTGRLTASANGAATQALSSLISGTAGLQGGYLRIAADQPILAFADVTASGSDRALILGQSLPASGSGEGGGGGGGGGGGPGLVMVSASPATMDFGSVNVGTTSPARPITVTNRGTGPVTITVSVAAPFAASPATLNLAAGAAGTISVTFTPVSATPSRQEGTLTISAGGTTAGTVALTGTAATTGGGGGTTGCLVPPTNLVSFFPGDGSGSDITGGNTATPSGGASYGTGHVGQAFAFNGSTGYAHVGDPANLRFTTGMTIEAWINLRSGRAGNLSAIATKWGQIFTDTPDSDSWGLWVNNTATGPRLFSALHFTGAREASIEGGAVAAGSWTHVAMTYDGASGRYRLYLNGIPSASQNAPGTIFASNRTVMIGREDSFETRYFDGLIDELSFYNRELSASEIQSIYNASTQGKCKSGGGGGGGGTVTVSATPSSLDFGSVASGTTSPSRPVTISNSGTAAASLTIAATAPFAVTPASVTVAAGGTATVNVTFSPAASAVAGTRADSTLSINSNTGTVLARVTLTGTVAVAGPGGGTGGSCPSSVNIALNKPASQSSTAFGGAASNGVNGVLEPDFGVHTDEQINPWWQVDLGQISTVCQARIFNRANPEFLARARSIAILASDDGNTFRQVYRHDDSVWGAGGSPLSPQVAPFTGRYIRLRLEENRPLYFNLREVELYGFAGTSGPGGGGGNTINVSATPSSIDFGSVASGTTSPSRPVTISNSGTAAATVTIAATAPFAVTPASVNVPAGGTATVNVTFSPASSAAAGARADSTLTISSNTGTVLARVTLTGTVTVTGPGGGTGGSCPSSVNIALNKPASQSSTAFGGAASNGVNGVLEPDFGVHTDEQINPWWQVDLGQVSTVCQARIYNRVSPEFLSRARSIAILASDDGNTFRQVYRHDDSVWGAGGSPLSPQVAPFTGRYIRLRLEENRPLYFNLREVELYGFAGGVPGGGGGGATSAVTVSPSSLTFATAVAVGATSQPMTVTLNNTGTATANVTITVAGPFTAAPPALSIGAGSSSAVTVTFRPAVASPAQQTGTLQVNVGGAVAATISLSGTAGSSTPMPSCQVAPTNLVSFFPGDGSGADIRGGNTANLTGGANYATGQVGQAFQFNGTTGYAQVGNPANLRFTTGMTIEAWINLRGSTNGVLSAIATKWGQIFTDTPDSDSWGLWVNTTAAGGRQLFSALHFNGARETTLEGGAIALNTWTHVAMTYDSAASRFRLYVNGQQTATIAGSGAIYPSNRNVTIGREDSFQTRYFNGLIDEVSFYSRELSAAEIQSIFSAGSNGKCR